MKEEQEKIIKIWDDLYKSYEKNKPVGLEYPKEPLIRWINTQRKQLKKKTYFRDTGVEHTLRNDFKGNALEIGFGTVANIKFMRRKGYQCYGLEVSKEAVRRGKMQLNSERIKNIKLSYWKPPKIPYSSNKFEIVFGLQCLYYNLELEKVISEIHRVLKHGGKFMFSFFSPKHDYMKYTKLITPNIIQWTNKHPNPRLWDTLQRRIKSKQHLRNLFSEFKNIRIFTLETDQTALFTSWWYITGEK